MIIMGIIIGLTISVIALFFIALGGAVLYGIISAILHLFIRDSWQRDDILEEVFGWIASICVLIALVVGMYGGIPEAMIDTVEWSPYENYVTHEIMNLSDNQEINGKFTGGRYVRGFIGEETVYHYYFKRADGGMELQKANENNTTIYFTDSQPRAEWYRRTRTYWHKTEVEYVCKIYIPEGSMITEFAIDME